MKADWIAKPPSVHEHNPTGAGDALVAGVVWGLKQEMSLVEVLRWGVACGAAGASTHGTGVGSKEQIKGLEKEIKITSL